MGAYIQVPNGEDLAAALRRFNEQVRHVHDRPWAKPKRGYYEKPSAIRRKRRMTRGYGEIKLWISLEKLHRREGPFGRCQ